MSDYETLTLMIPTRNRPIFLRRVLDYYRRVHWPYSIFIADASDSGIFEETASQVRALKKNLEITHQSFPSDLGVHATWAQMLEKVETPFAIVSGDDDFLIPQALQRCAAFLNTHPDYSLASGFAVRPTVRQTAQEGFEVVDMQAGIFKSNEKAKASDRLLDCFYPSWAPNAQALQRTPQMRETFRTAIALGLDVDEYSDFFCECAINGVNVIKGKEKKFSEFLSLVMLKHGRQIYRSKSMTMLDRFTSPHFPKVAENIFDWWARELVQKENGNLEEAKRVAGAAFMYLIHMKSFSGFRDILEKIQDSSPRRKLAQLPFARKLWHAIRPTRYQVTLAALLNKRSPYHEDFLEVHAVLSEPARREPPPKSAVRNRKLTLMIATRNRPHFLKKVLEYYKKSDWPYALFISDASDPEFFEEIDSWMRDSGKNLDIIHRAFPVDLGIHATWAQVLETIETPFAVASGDDDFLIPSAMERCMEFLERHPDYSMASGFALRPTVQPEGENGFEIVSVQAGIYRSIEGEKAAQRLLNCFNLWAPNTFTVQRTSQMKETFQEAARRNLDCDAFSDFFCEIAINGVNVIKGKEKKFDDFLSMVMLKHNQRSHRTRAASVFDRMTSDSFPAVAKGTVDWWAEELLRHGELGSEQARQIAQTAFMSLIHRKSLSGLRGILGGLKSDFTKKIPPLGLVARKVWHRLRPARYKISLPVLLKKNSIYHKDFMEVVAQLGKESS